MRLSMEMTSLSGFQRGLVLGALVVSYLSAQGLQGVVVGPDGLGLAGARVIASGVSFRGWAETDARGVFQVERAGRFISVRHKGFQPVLKRVAELSSPVLIRLEKAGTALRVLPSCGTDAAVIGERLRVRAPGGRYEGPMNGEHDTHWYVRTGKGELHVASGYALHAGLPPEHWLVESERIETRGWERGGSVGVDLAGELPDGRRWRWIGALLMDQVSYYGASPEVAIFFDQVIKTLCASSVLAGN